MKRPYGSGSIEPFRDRFRARAPRQPDGRRPVLDTCDSPEAAAVVLDAYLTASSGAGDVGSGAMTLRVWGPKCFEKWEADGKRSVEDDQSRWKHHVTPAPFIDWPLQNIEKGDIKAWLTGLAKVKAADIRAKEPKPGQVYLRKPRKISPQTRKHCLNLLRKALEEAVEDGKLAENPAEGVHAPKIEESPFDYLAIEEQRQLARCEQIPEADRVRAMFSWGTGIRQFDQWAMKLSDLRLDAEDPDVFFWCHKLGRRTRVPLFGPALVAVKRQLELLPEYCPENDRGLLWPLPSGAQRQRSKNYGWGKMLLKAGIRRHVKWHELRDTCASSLLNGWWGPKWRLEEVKEMLVHSSIEVTERYAHLAPSSLSRIAGETIGHQLAITSKGRRAKNARKQGCAKQESNLRPSASEAYRELNGCAGLIPVDGQLVAKIDAVIQAGPAGDPGFARLALDLALELRELLTAASLARRPA